MSKPLDMLIDDARAQVLQTAMAQAVERDRATTRHVLSRMMHYFIVHGSSQSATIMCGALFILEGQWAMDDHEHR